MDQESFRKLLQTPKPSGTPTAPTARGSLLAAASKAKSKTVASSQPAFKPRTVKKKAQADQAYRDRASERRQGVGNDYAQVEALAEDFEKRTAENADRAAVEEQRRYLGGDSDHTVLVKGLDFALLEQNRARLAASSGAVDDESLEQVFREVAATAPRKRTREEIVQELKAKRAKTSSGPEDTDAGGDEKPTAAGPALKEAKKAGKFRPIGFKPIGGGSEKTKKKKLKAKIEGQEGEPARKKKVKSDVSAGRPPPELTPTAKAGPSTVIEPPAPLPKAAPPPEPEPVDEDFDIFAGVGEYTGVDLGDDDESEHEHSGREREEGEAEETPPPPKARWVAVDEEQPGNRASPSPPKAGPPEASPPANTQHTPVAAAVSDHEEGEEEEERPMRLQPLASSAIPSIRDLLDMDASSGKRKRGGKKGKKKDNNAETEGGVDKNKIDRDYKRRTRTRRVPALS
ncbi:RED-like protein N-terminal region-domain-containing protein [Rhodofomes roseus]|uniref:RED-like protein N-terminal region-domain-containing protein n=1 Tax=Rhodofomes roseus TaxID=34475 RepID=A0ABQ8KPG0_9APHY|nr:RED-like protein N-terminal region-domain-containing protein [Rhodofomes roseus]KAH9840043.1 RED-like protein N-terminal region-domain-containing protein [Rhodofomes roseus]